MRQVQSVQVHRWFVFFLSCLEAAGDKLCFCPAMLLCSPNRKKGSFSFPGKATKPGVTFSQLRSYFILIVFWMCIENTVYVIVLHFVILWLNFQSAVPAFLLLLPCRWFLPSCTACMMWGRMSLWADKLLGFIYNYWSRLILSSLSTGKSSLVSVCLAFIHLTDISINSPSSNFQLSCYWGARFTYMKAQLEFHLICARNLPVIRVWFSKAADNYTISDWCCLL